MVFGSNLGLPENGDTSGPHKRIFKEETCDQPSHFPLHYFQSNKFVSMEHYGTM